jgi:hypothetical protein
VPGEPVLNDGVWWLRQDDGSWLRWDETSRQWIAWVDPNARAGAEALSVRTVVQTDPTVLGPAPVTTGSSTAGATWGAVQSDPGQRKPRSKAPLLAILAVIVLGIVAVTVYAITAGGNADDDRAGPSRARGVGPAQAGLSPLACEHTGSGRTFEVGQGEALKSLGEVPWETLAAGDAVRIHWRAEPYREKFFLRGQGTEDQPIVVCGVAGPDGALPVIDGQNAVTRRGLPTPNSGAGEPRGLIHITLGADDLWGYKPEFIVI